MDLVTLFYSILQFIELTFFLAIISFVGYKIFSPLREKLADKYKLSWVKSCFVFNLVLIFLVIFSIYAYFFFTGLWGATPRDPDIDFGLIDQIVLLILPLGRILVASIILALCLLFFELLASFFMIDKKEMKRRSRSKGLMSSPLFNQFVGIFISSAVFILLLFFVFSWVPLGLFVFIFYGTVQPLPLFILN